jgi:hypothetical protein
MVDVIGRYDPCSSFAVFPSRCTAIAGWLSDDDMVGHRVDQDVSTGVGDAVLVIERPLIRCAQTVTTAGDSLTPSTSEPFATALALRHTVEGSRTLVSRQVEHTSRAIKAPIVALKENRLADRVPAGCEVRLIEYVAAGALWAASARETVLCTELGTVKGNV